MKQYKIVYGIKYDNGKYDIREFNCNGYNEYLSAIRLYNGFRYIVATLYVNGYIREEHYDGIANERTFSI